MKNNRSEKNKFTMSIVKSRYFITIENASEKTEGRGHKRIEDLRNYTRWID